MSTPPVQRRRSAPFRPRFTLMILYVFAFTVLYALAFVAPALYEIWRTMPPGPEQQEAARIAAQGATHFHLSVFAAIVTVGLGAWARVLPGLRAD